MGLITGYTVVVATPVTLSGPILVRFLSGVRVVLGATFIQLC